MFQQKCHDLFHFPALYKDSRFGNRMLPGYWPNPSHSWITSSEEILWSVEIIETHDEHFKIQKAIQKHPPCNQAVYFYFQSIRVGEYFHFNTRMSVGPQGRVRGFLQPPAL